MWQALLGLIPSLIGTAMSAGQSKTGPAPEPPKPKPEFQPMQRQPLSSRQLMSFDPGGSPSPIQDPQMEALANFRRKLGL